MMKWLYGLWDKSRFELGSERVLSILVGATVEDISSESTSKYKQIIFIKLLSFPSAICSR